MKVAALNDIHGNVAALQAALQEVERERPDAIVFGGDVATGPFARETLAVLMSLGDRAHFVRGNADREIVAAYDADAVFDESEPNPARRAAAWLAGRITREERDFLAGFRGTVVLDVDELGPTLFCHGSPRSDEEVITHLTPEGRLSEFVAGVGASVVVCGHTHMQFERAVGETRVVNAGSVGMPYEGKPGAFWLSLGPDIRFRHTEYDVEAAAERLASHPEGENLAAILLRPPAKDDVAAFFEGTGPEPEV
jgi:predicted phosphodiesterase